MKKAIAITALVLMASSLTACGKSTFQATGTVTVMGDVSAAGMNKSCSSLGGYDDVNEGAQVKATAEGTTVAVGKLEPGSSAMDNYACKFKFTLDEVPSGKKFYSLEVSHRGALEFSEDELKTGIELTIGG